MGSQRQIDGSVVAITGGAGGIGLALGRAMLGAGAKVALLDIAEPALDEAAAQLGGGDAGSWSSLQWARSPGGCPGSPRAPTNA